MIAGVLSQALDTVLFITIAFYGVVDPASGQPLPIANIMSSQIIAKLALVVVFVPILISADGQIGPQT